MPRWGVLISKPVAEAIRAGTVTQAFRRWDVPRVKVGGLQLTPAGLVRFDAVSQVRDPAKLTERDARKAGVKSLAALQDSEQALEQVLTSGERLLLQELLAKVAR